MDEYGKLVEVSGERLVLAPFCPP